jgi:RES domain-containing protein
LTTLWRITTPRHEHDALSGEGASRYSARWNPKGTRILYTATSAALAILEYLANLSLANAPDTIVLVRIECASQIPLMQRSALPKNWADYPAPKSTQQLGKAWVKASTSLALGVPSVVLPTDDDYDVLLNPQHADKKHVKVMEKICFRAAQGSTA